MNSRVMDSVGISGLLDFSDFERKRKEQTNRGQDLQIVII
jgi:hypothetical protein